jgi:hypothetical protein
MGIQTYTTIEVDSVNGNSSTQVDVLYNDIGSAKIRGISINGTEIRLADWIAIVGFVKSKTDSHFDEAANITKKNLVDAGFEVTGHPTQLCRNCNQDITGLASINGYCKPCYHSNVFPPKGD